MSDHGLRGAELARRFHTEVVGPLLARKLPRLRYAAGRLGSGSDVLGLDDVTSRDHDWGCRLTLLVDELDSGVVPQVSELLERELPETYREYRVRFPVTWDSSRSHRVEVATVAGFAASRLGVGTCLRPAGSGWNSSCRSSAARPSAATSSAHGC